MHTQQILLSILGSWQLTRILPDAKIYQGTATFNKINSENLLYKEKLKVKLESYKDTKNYHKINQFLFFHKEYIYNYQQGDLYKYFIDSEKNTKLFYKIQFMSDNNAHGIHICQSDQYQAHYKFDLPNYFSLTYKVHGPEKEYQITSLYTKLL